MEEEAHQRPAPVRRHRLDRKKNKKSRKGKLSKEEVAAVRTQVKTVFKVILWENAKWLFS